GRGITLAPLRDAALVRGGKRTPLGGQSGTPGGDGARRPREKSTRGGDAKRRHGRCFFPDSMHLKHSRGRRAAVRLADEVRRVPAVTPRTAEGTGEGHLGRAQEEQPRARAFGTGADRADTSLSRSPR